MDNPLKNECPRRIRLPRTQTLGVPEWWTPIHTCYLPWDQHCKYREEKNKINNSNDIVLITLKMEESLIEESSILCKTICLIYDSRCSHF